ncbi:YciI family protein [Baekduia soli]|uniref:YciI family protein n=1 Tax=Baekduia soli TaxID=496014 RepID=A0A5B8TZY9_9ACTN|nr:YciI family protein [Baekduia soli]QEC46297.1 YciI family protein [Baekduia soli]
MKYMLLLYVPPEGRDHPDAAGMEAWFGYTRALQEAGVLVAGDALQGLEAATTVRVRGGETLVADGPFAETKEMLGGYYLIDVPDLDAALAWAAKVPNAPYGSVEVRPLMELPAEVPA